MRVVCFGNFYKKKKKNSFIRLKAMHLDVKWQRITGMPCSNAGGTHKKKWLVVGKPINHRVFKNVNLPVLYKKIKIKVRWLIWFLLDGFMKHFFIEWRNFLKNKTSQRALFIVDNCPSHPYEDELKCKGDMFVDYSYRQKLHWFCNKWSKCYSNSQNMFEKKSPYTVLCLKKIVYCSVRETGKPWNMSFFIFSLSAYVLSNSLLKFCLFEIWTSDFLFCK